MAKKVMITCAVTGSIHTPSMSPYLPVTPQEIADAAIGAAEAGAAIVHLHARDPNDGKPTQDPNMFREFLPTISKRSDVIIKHHYRWRSDNERGRATATRTSIETRSCVSEYGVYEFRIVRDAESL